VDGSALAWAAFLVSGRLCENRLNVKISAVIITFNEEMNISDAIRSVDFADEVLVVDSESNDETREIAATSGARVIVQPWLGFGRQKQFATEQATHHRILSIDADERISGKLRSEIMAIRERDNALDGYRIPRLTTYMGRPIRHGGWYPDSQLRFFDRTKGRWKDTPVHESVQMEPNASVGRLRGDILHIGSASINEHLAMIRTRYGPLSAKAMHHRGERSSILKMCISPALSFLGGYLLKAGFLDGIAGLHIARLGAYNVYLKHKLLRSMQDATTR
jgi:glycosyltransferase involved in cell wall biosynthesis